MLFLPILPLLSFFRTVRRKAAPAVGVNGLIVFYCANLSDIALIARAFRDKLMQFFLRHKNSLPVLIQLALHHAVIELAAFARLASEAFFKLGIRRDDAARQVIRNHFAHDAILT